MESLAHLEVLCERLYNSQDSAERTQAENMLKCFSDNKDYIVQCQYILDNSSSPYAQMLASSSLLKQINGRNLSIHLLLDIRIYLIKYLASRGPELEPYVVTSLIQLLCRLTKIGWFDDDMMKELVKDSTSFLTQESPKHYAIGLKILDQLVSEMNMSSPGLYAMHNRMASYSFRDHSLLQIFDVSLKSLHQLKNNVLIPLKELALSVSLKCLSFDFVGNSIDESSEEVGTVQLPSSWRPFLEDPSTLQIFFDYYIASETPISKDALECLVRLASVRRSSFTHGSSRTEFLTRLMEGISEILRTGHGLADHDNYNEFCRLLGRLRVNYQLAELVNAEGYREWLHLVAEFTSKSLKSWKWTRSSVQCIIRLWSRLVTSVPHLKGDSPSLLEQFVPKIAEEFILSKLESVQVGFPDDFSGHPLDNVELVQGELDYLPFLCRFKYESSSLFMIKVMQPILQLYKEWSHAQKNDLAIVEGKLAWIVHVIAAILKIKQYPAYSSETHESIDAELSGRVLQLINITDKGMHSKRYGEPSKQRLDRSILTFFHHFRKSCDEAMYSSTQLHARLSDLVGLDDHVLLLDVIVGKLAINLKFYAASQDVIEQTLSVFFALASGYMTGKLLLNLDTVKFILSNHTKEHFPFLQEGSCSHTRTVFYYTIGCLIFMEDDPLQFMTSMEPLVQTFSILESTPDAIFRVDSVKYALISLTRDLRGIAMAANSRRSYDLLFDWLYPSHMPLLLKVVMYWVDTPEVTTPLLKFMAEFVFNRAQRLAIDSSSPRGILLFREVSKLVCAYGSNILSLPNPDDVYASKYKGIWICLVILWRVLSGNYVNFAVFELYGDKTLADALDIAVKMALSIPLDDIMAYGKLMRPYFSFMEVLFNTHISFVLNLSTSTFMHLVGSLHSGLKSLYTGISSQCASSIDNVASFYFNNLTSAAVSTSPAAASLARHIADCPNLFAEILKTLFEIVLFEDCSNQWSLSRPMLSLIVINEQMYADVKAHIFASQPDEQHRRISSCFDKLMMNVDRSLDPENRDVFTENLSNFRHEFLIK